MGVFESAAPFYLASRAPYAQGFFVEAKRRLGLTGRERLLDLGCGPGMLAIGFAPFVGSAVGVDPEPAMLAAARAAAAAAGVALELHAARVEDLQPSFGPFDVACVGRARHWMVRQRALEVLEALVGAGGCLLFCNAEPTETGANPWLSSYLAIKEAWRVPTPGRQPRMRVAKWLLGSRFEIVDRISVRHRHPVTVANLVDRLLSHAANSPAALGERVPEMRRSLEAALAPFFGGGSVLEEVETHAQVVRRRR